MGYPVPGDSCASGPVVRVAEHARVACSDGILRWMEADTKKEKRVVGGVCGLLGEDTGNHLVAQHCQTRLAQVGQHLLRVSSRTPDLFRRLETEYLERRGRMGKEGKSVMWQRWISILSILSPVIQNCSLFGPEMPLRQR